MKFLFYLVFLPMLITFTYTVIFYNPKSKLAKRECENIGDYIRTVTLALFFSLIPVLNYFVIIGYIFVNLDAHYNISQSFNNWLKKEL